MARRGRGEGSVFKRKDRNLWQATITVGYDEKRKRIRKTVYGKTRKECLDKKMALQAKLVTSGVALSGNLTVEQVLERWIVDVCKGKLKRSTVSSYEGIVKNHITPAVGKVKLSAIEAKHIQNVLTEMETKNLSESTKKHAFTILNACLKWCVKIDLIPKNPCGKIDAPKPVDQEQAVYNREEIAALLKSASDTEKHRLGAVVVLAICTGARQGEIFGLKWEDIDFKNSSLSIRRKVIEIGGKIFVESPKTKKSKRPIKLPRLAVDALQEHRKRMMAEGFGGSGWVFPSQSGEPMRRQSFNRWAWKAIVEGATLDGEPIRKIPFKNLRHAHATVLLSTGTHPKVVQERLGHSRISTTMDTYTHVIPTMQEEAANIIDDLFSGAG